MAAAFYEKALSVDEMRAGGYEPEDFEGDVVEVWPENWPAFTLFAQLQTQWNSGGMGGRTGLRYEAIYPLLDRQAKGKEWDDLFRDIQVMELAALKQMSDDAG